MNRRDVLKALGLAPAVFGIPFKKFAVLKLDLPGKPDPAKVILKPDDANTWMPFDGQEPANMGTLMLHRADGSACRFDAIITGWQLSKNSSDPDLPAMPMYSVSGSLEFTSTGPVTLTQAP